MWVVVHSGALPDWQIARGGWADPDVLANWGCWIDRLGRALLEAVDGWFALWDPLGEAACYDRDARRIGRVLLDAQAVARLELHRGSGAGPLPVGAVLKGPAGLRERWAARTWVESAASGKLRPPWALAGELSNGTGALDVLGLVGGGAELAEGVRVVTFGSVDVPGDVMERFGGW